MANNTFHGRFRRGKHVKIESFAGALEYRLQKDPHLDPQTPITFDGRTKEAGVVAWEYVQHIARDNQLAAEGMDKRNTRADEFVSWYKRLSPEG